MSNGMNEMEQIITQIAQSCKKSDEFICKLKESFKVLPDEKGSFFLQAGTILYGFSYFSLALISWDHALNCFIKNKDKSGESACYTNLGTVYYSIGEYRKAIEYYERSLQIDKEIGDRAGESKCYADLGNAYADLGQIKRAIEYYERSLQIDKEIGDRAGESKCYADLGNAYADLGQIKRAIEYYERSLQIDKEIGDRTIESACLTGLGVAYEILGDFRRSIEYHEKSLEMSRQIGDEAGKAKSYINLGNVQYNLGHFKEALTYHEKSLEIADKIGNKAGKAKCYGNIGSIYRDLGDFRKALTYHEKSLEIADKIGNRTIKLTCYINMGIAYHDLGDLKKALTYHGKSLEIADKIGNKAGKEKCYGNLGNAYADLGQIKRAIEYYERSLQIDKEIGDRAGESACYTNLGNAYADLGDFRRSIEYHEKSLEMSKEIGDRAGESACYTNLGNAYADLGQNKRAIEYYERSLQIDKETGNKAGELTSFGNVGSANCKLGNFEKAISFQRKSLEIAERIGDKAGELRCYVNLGIAYYNLENLDKALKYHKKSLKIAKEIRNKVGEARSYVNLGNVYRELGDSRKAIECLQKSLEIVDLIGDMDLKRIIHLNLGLVYSESESPCAYDYYKRSIDLSEMIIGNLVEEPHKIGFSHRASDAYHLMIPLCLTLKKIKEVFEYTEKSKSRAFLDILATTEIKPTVEITGELKSLLDKEEKNLAKLRAIQMRHLSPTKVPVEPGKVEQIYESLTQIYSQIEKFDAEYVFVRRGKPPSLNKIQAIFSSQNKDIVLIEYFIMEEKTYTFVISSRDQFHIKSVPFPVETFNQYLKDWKKIAFSVDFQNMSNYLIEPVSEYLNEGDLIYFVPYGPLHYFPLHALTINGEPLIKTHPVAYLPSASLIQFCQKKGTGTLQSCASFGIDFEKEAEDIAALFDTEAYLDDLATKENIKTCSKDIIHFACHGKFDDKDPLSSRILLHDGELTARDIFNLRLSTELVTLSACETGYNQRSPGDELIGLTRAFLYAGTPSVIVSLWPVYGPSTQKLMAEFYTQLKNGTDKANALQRAQIKMMEHKKYSHPFHWAPFVLVGDWK